MAKDPVRRRFWLLVASTAVLASIAILIRTLGHDTEGRALGIWFELAVLLFVVLVPTILTLACAGVTVQVVAGVQACPLNRSTRTW
ncbi:Hypothetical protein RM25_0271 [Propionibacterium freudenreichii subsp. freudenreichii]|nr:Hypothetical protein RM25_0271 [Propionibacterium freudenreichii subsp. freudenreichii]